MNVLQQFSAEAKSPEEFAENLSLLSPTQRDNVRDYWLFRVMRALWGDLTSDDDDRKAGLIDEFRALKRAVLVGGSVAGVATLALQIITTFQLQDPIKLSLIHLLGGPR
jgi:hypothetical protein